MGWSFRKSIRLGKGLRINLSRRGIGWSIGSKLLRFGVSGGRSRVSSGVGPFRYQKTLPQGSGGGGGCGCLSLLVIVLAVVGVVGSMQSGTRTARSDSKASAPRATPVPLSVETQPKSRSIAPTETRNSQPALLAPPGTMPRPLPVGPAAEAAKRRAIVRFPQISVPGSALNRAFVERAHRYQTDRPQIFDDAEWPTVIARECAAQLNP